MKKDHQVTIKDIARALNISTSTVSRAMRNMPDVNQATKKAVLALAEELDYFPDSIALSLVKKKTNTLGVIVPDLITHFFSSAISGIQEVAAQAGYNVMIAHSLESFETEKKNVHTLISSRADGLIISCTVDTQTTEHFQTIVDRGIPLVFFDRVPEEMEVTKVTIDDHEGARMAVEHLIKAGYRRIAHISGPTTLSICRRRILGYTDTLKAHNIPVEENLIFDSKLKDENVKEITRALINSASPPDAILCVNDLVALVAMIVIKEAGLRIPDDIALIGFGNEPVTSWVHPTLSTINQFPQDLGRFAAKEILDQLANRGQDQISYLPKNLSIKPKLEARGSTMPVSTPLAALKR